MKNKTLLTLAFCGLLFIACKKDYVCVCEYSTITTDFSSSVQTKGGSETSYTKVTKKYANEKCDSGKDIATTGTGTNSVKVDRVWNCTLN